MPRFAPGKVLSVLAMGCAFILVGGVSVALIVEKAMTPELRDDVLCAAGLTEFADDACVSERIDTVVADLRRDLDLADSGLTGRIVFTEGANVAGLTVIVGTIYRDHAARSGVVRAICWGIQDRTGLDPRLTLAEMDASGVARALSVDAFERSAINIDLADIIAARNVCPWPDIRS